MTQSEKLYSDVMEAVAGASDNVWSKVGAVFAWAQEAIIEIGCEHQQFVVDAADKAIDYLIAIDIPQLPDVVEIYVDGKLGKAAKAWVRDELKKVCGQ